MNKHHKASSCENRDSIRHMHACYKLTNTAGLRATPCSVLLTHSLLVSTECESVVAEVVSLVSLPGTSHLNLAILDVIQSGTHDG